MNIRVHIDRLVLDDALVAPCQSAALRTAVEAELARLLRERGLSAALRRGARIPHIAASSVAQSHPGQPALLGRRIAAAVHGRLTR